MSKQREILDALNAFLFATPGIAGVTGLETSPKDLPAAQSVPGAKASDPFTARTHVKEYALFGVWLVANTTQVGMLDLGAAVMNKLEVKDGSGNFLGISSVEITDVLCINFEPFETEEAAGRGERRWLLEVKVEYVRLRGQA